jgi:hypothetical protein
MFMEVKEKRNQAVFEIRGEKKYVLINDLFV